MNYVKVMISQFYKGGAWDDEATGLVFDPKKDRGKVIVIPTSRDLTGIREYLMNQQLVPVDGYSKEEMEAFANAGLAKEPSVVDVMGRYMSLEVVFDRPVYPIPGKTLTVPTAKGVQTLQATDAFMEGLSTAVYQVNANGPIQVEAGAFIDDYKLLSKAYGKPATVPVTGVSASPKTVNGKPGDKAKITSTVAPADATNKAITWTSDKPAVVTVLDTGDYTLVANGTATLTVKTADGDKVDTVAVTVTTPVTGVSVDKQTVTGKPTDTGKITATVAPATASNKAVTFASSNATIVTVDNAGNYTLKADGTATITAKTTDGNKTAVTNVTVTTPAEPEVKASAASAPKKRATKKKDEVAE